MVKDRILLDYLDFVLKNGKIYDEIFIENEYDRYSEIIGVDDRLRNHYFGLKNLLLRLEFITEVEPRVYFFTDKGIEAHIAGGYYKYIKSKNKLNNYQKLALLLSSIAILFTGYNTYFKTEDSASIESLKCKLSNVTYRLDSLSQKSLAHDNNFLRSNADTVSIESKKIVPNK